MKSKEELQAIVERIASENSPVGMDAVYVHALILDKLESIEQRLSRLENIVSNDEYRLLGPVTVDDDGRITDIA